MAKEYISRDEMIEQIKARIVLGAPKFNTGLEAAIEVATSLPAADVKGFSRGQYVDRFLLRDQLFTEGAILMGGVAIINNFPAADVVAVVRCRECKHYNAGFECLIEGYGIERPADYFCADGERKDGGQDE